MSQSDTTDNNLIEISLSGTGSNIGFQNPISTYTFDLETPKLNTNNSIVDDYTKIRQNFNERLFPIQRSTFVKDVDIVCCKKVFSIKANTYYSFKRCTQMLIPLGVLIVLILVLIVLFRVDVFIQNEEIIDD